MHPVRMSKSLIAVMAAALARGPAACGGGDEGEAGAGEETAPAASEGPPVAQVIDVAKKNKGFAKCRKVEPGLERDEAGGSEPEVIQAILCDDATVGNYFRYESAEAAAAYEPTFDDRPYFVAGDVVVSTGDAVLAKTYDAEGARTLPDELKAACGCGEVKTPPPSG